MRTLASPARLALALTVVLLNCRCSGSSQSAPDSNTAANPPAQQSTDDNSAKESSSSEKENPADQRPGYCKNVDSTVNICSDDATRNSVDSAASEPVNGLR